MKRISFLLFILPFSARERLVYDVYLLRLKAGKVETVTIGEKSIEGENLYHISCRIKSIPPFSALYKIDDRIDVFVQKETLLPIFIEKHINRGRENHHLYKKIDQAQLFAKIKKDGEERIVPIINPTFDIISIFYYLRKKFPEIPPVVGILKEGGVHFIMIKKIGEEKIMVGKKIYDTILLKQYPEEIMVWLTKDERIPLKIKAKTKWGPCVLLLERWER